MELGSSDASFGLGKTKYVMGRSPCLPQSRSAASTFLGHPGRGETVSMYGRPEIFFLVGVVVQFTHI